MEMNSIFILLYKNYFNHLKQIYVKEMQCLFNSLVHKLQACTSLEGAYTDLVVRGAVVISCFSENGPN